MTCSGSIGSVGYLLLAASVSLALTACGGGSADAAGSGGSGVADGTGAAGVVNPAYPLTSLLDFTAGAQADLNDPAMQATRPGSGDNPYFMPDWNGNGVFGEQADIALEHTAEPRVAKFLYPCIATDGKVTYRTVTNTCAPANTPGVQFRYGEIRKEWIIDARGSRLAARLLLPEEAQQPGASKLPAVVFSDGAMFPMSSFYAFGMSFARDGLIVLHYDHAGQGDSEASNGGTAPDCPTPAVWGNFCLDVQDAVRWLFGQDIMRIVAGGHNPAYAPEGDNYRNPIIDRVDLARVGIAGQSAGSVATTMYLHYLSQGKGTDGRPLPAVAAAVALSGLGHPSAAIVPLQVQSADYDIPGVTADNFGANVSDGPTGTHAWYEDLRASGKGNAPLEELIIESGSHGDSSNVSSVPHAVWSLHVGTGYAADWFNCYLQGDLNACASAYKPREHLSRVQASEYDKDGPAGPEPSRCLTIPDQVNAGLVTNPQQAVNTLAMQKNYDCTP